ncbi:MAG: sulfatase [Planctomycetes bacterium]|nr:sulfatase [Planctomycetota bacterium]
MRRLVLAALLLGCALVAFERFRARSTCAAGDGGPPDAILVVCIDTLRADALDGDASGPSPMPGLEKLAHSGVRFTGAVAPSSWTGASVGSLLTGLDPLRHGVHVQDGDARLSPRVRSVAQLLREHGWWTFASTSGGWAGAGTGFARGFDRFDEGFDRRAPEETASTWRSSRPSRRPCFVWLHTYAAHDPYGDKGWGEPPADAAERVQRGRAIGRRFHEAQGDDVAGARRAFLLARLSDRWMREGIEQELGVPRAMELWASCVAWMRGGWQADPADRAVVDALRAAYRAQLHDVDQRVARAVAAFQDAEPGARIAVIVTSDHGEGFGAHATLGHGLDVSEDLVRVPLLLRAPGVAAGRTVPARCGLVDVAPTILELAGVAPPADLDGRSLLGLLGPRGHGRPVPSSVHPIESALGLDGPTSCRVALRSDALAAHAAFDFAQRRWVAEQWFDLERDPREARALRAAPPASADPAFAVAWAELRSRVERRYASDVGPSPRPPGAGAANVAPSAGAAVR